MRGHHINTTFELNDILLTNHRSRLLLLNKIALRITMYETNQVHIYETGLQAVPDKLMSTNFQVMRTF